MLALLCGLLAFLVVPALVAVPLGLVVLFTRRPGRWLAVGGLVATLVWGGVLAWLGSSGAVQSLADRVARSLPSASASRPASPAPTDAAPSPRDDVWNPPRTASGALSGTADMEIGALRIGDCFNDSAGGPSGDQWVIQGVRCSTPHEFEVFANPQLRRGPYPAEAEMNRLGEKACAEFFEPWVGVPEAQSRFTFDFLIPTEEAWAAGGRSVMCVLSDGAGRTGSARDSRH